MRLATKVSCLLALSALAVPSARAGAHTWDVWEVFSNADGSVQFVELHEADGGPTEVGIGGHMISASPSGKSYTIQHSIIGGTALRYYLIATPGFAALPGAPVPDEVTAPGVLLVGLSDTSVSYVGFDTATWGAGALPLDGIHSLQRPAKGATPVSSINSPTNYSTNVPGSVDASPGAGLAGVPGLQASRVTADGSSISVSFDNGACTGALDKQILYGQRSGLPAIAGGTYTLLGGACSIGTASPYVWNPTPTDSDGSGLIWFLVVNENNANNEGPWGTYDGVNERAGPGTNGSSGVCGINDKIVSNTCGH